MAETNFIIDIRWLTPKTCLLPHPQGHMESHFMNSFPLSKYQACHC